MKETTIWESLRLPNQDLLFDLEGLYQALQTVKDQRARYSLSAASPAVARNSWVSKEDVGLLCAGHRLVGLCRYATGGRKYWIIFLILHNSCALSSPLSDQYVCLQGH